MEPSYDMRSDDDRSIPDLQLSSVTRALLARHNGHPSAIGSGPVPIASGSVDIDRVGDENDESNNHDQPRPRRSLRITSIRRNHYSTPRTAPEQPEDYDGDERFPITESMTGANSLHRPPRRLFKRSTPASVPYDELLATNRDEGETNVDPITDNPPSRAPVVHRDRRLSDQLDDVDRRPHLPSAAQDDARQPSAQKKRTSRTPSFRFSPTQEQRPGLNEIKASQAAPIANAIPKDLHATERVVPVHQKRKPQRRFIVNGESYTVLRKLGKGGSGRVYEVLSRQNETWAFKVIPLGGLDSRARALIENEVSLLNSLKDKGRIVYLKDWAIEENKKCLYIVMELGQSDLDNMIKDQIRLKPKLDLPFVGFYWLEMLRCVDSIHKLGVVHSDLKPANFVIVEGVLNLVDFGIANAIPDDTVNVYKDQQAGTPNYMAPETLRILANPAPSLENRRVKFGKPSDMWSLGCILYQMIYGRQPFAHVQGLAAKLMAINEPQHAIEFAEEGLGGVKVPAAYLRTMRMCLSRDANKRPTVDQLLEKGDGLLPPVGRTDGVAYVNPEALQAMLITALCEGEAWASPGEIKTLAGQIMGKVERDNRRGPRE